VVADYMNLLNASMLTLVGTSSKTLTGSDYTVSASGNSLLKFLSLLQTAKTTVKTGVDQYKNYASLEDSDPNSKRAQIADIVAKGAGCLDSLGNIVFKSVSAGMSVAAAKKDLLLKPHNNLVSLTASAAASNASWRSKESPSASLPVLLGLFGNFLSAAADVSDGVVDSKDLAKGKDEQGQGGADPDLSFSRKILSASQAMGSKLADIITQFTSFFLTLAALIKASGKPKGIVINNSDSYVNIKARNYASLSGHGPVIIESTKTSLADLLRLGTFDLTRPHSPIKAESYASNPDFEDTNAVLTMTELARTIADEISLQSTRAVIAKSQNQIQLIAGLNPPETAAKNVYENARSAANTAYNAWNTSVPNLKSNKALALHNSTKSLLDIPMPPAYDSTHSKGILIMTKDKSMPITLQTSVPTSNIELLRGVANRPGTEADNKLLMSQAKTVLQADNNALLALTPTSSKAVLQADSTTNLTLEPNSAKLVAGNASSSLIMNASGTTLSGSTQLELKLGSNTFTMTDTNIKVTGPSLNLEGQSITKLGS
jgi:hypothetical protein